MTASRSELNEKIAAIDSQVREIERDVIARVAGLGANQARGRTDVARANIAKLLKKKRVLLRLWDEAT